MAHHATPRARQTRAQRRRRRRKDDGRRVRMQGGMRVTPHFIPPQTKQHAPCSLLRAACCVLRAWDGLTRVFEAKPTSKQASSSQSSPPNHGDRPRQAQRKGGWGQWYGKCSMCAHERAPGSGEVSGQSDTNGPKSKQAGWVNTDVVGLLSAAECRIKRHHMQNAWQKSVLEKSTTRRNGRRNRGGASCDKACPHASMHAFNAYAYDASKARFEQLGCDCLAGGGIRASGM